LLPPTVQVAAPPERFSAEFLEEAVGAAGDSAVMSAAAVGAPGRRDTTTGWGAGINVRAIRGDGPGEVSAETVTADVAKYDTMLSCGLGRRPRRHNR